MRLVPLLLLLAMPALAEPCNNAEEALRSWPDPDRLVAALNREREQLPKSIPESAYCRNVIAALDDKRLAMGRGVKFTAADIEAHAIDYERFRLETYVSSGVSPKRYFGFFDEQGDTAEYERTLRTTIAQAVPMVNALAAEKRLAVRVTDKEVAITFLAEGGALLLTERQAYLERIHPVRDIGLDSFRGGFAAYRTLVDRLDSQFGTRLGKLVLHEGPLQMLLRPMTFRDAILGVAVMYLYEKELTAGLRGTATPLMNLPLDRQFVVTSFVYNSGINFSDDRIEQVLHFATGDYLAGVNEQNKGSRPWLPVVAPDEARKRLEAGVAMPEQLTSWNAVYHVLQRFGAWTAVARFSGTFDDKGSFRPRSKD